MGSTDPCVHGYQDMVTSAPWPAGVPYKPSCRATIVEAQITSAAISTQSIKATNLSPMPIPDFFMIAVPSSPGNRGAPMILSTYEKLELALRSRDFKAGIMRRGTERLESVLALRETGCMNIPGDVGHVDPFGCPEIATWEGRRKATLSEGAGTALKQIGNQVRRR